ncbi:MAG: hypothetical protein H3C27_10290 [Opitutaceae bacterium]|nr:hypothetical protein [Opitutaceae bacterium]
MQKFRQLLQQAKLLKGGPAIRQGDNYMAAHGRIAPCFRFWVRLMKSPRGTEVREDTNLSGFQALRLVLSGNGPVIFIGYGGFLAAKISGKRPKIRLTGPRPISAILPMGKAAQGRNG